MKRCPECRRDYYDDGLLYCLDDGSRLLDGPATADEPATAVFRVPAVDGALGDRKTQILGASGYGPSEGAEQNNSIAVLPFINISADAENEYFCDGLAEELLNALSKIDNLKVAARTSAFSFKGKNTDIGEIAQKLGVKTVLRAA